MVFDDEAESCAPYPSETHADGKRNEGFFSLVLRPGVVDHLPEVEEFPALGNILRWTNRPDAPLSSTACDAGCVARDDGTLFAGGLIYFIRRALGENRSKDAWLSFSAMLTKFLPDNPDWRFRVEVRPLIHLYGDESSWAMKIEFGAIGNTVSGAWEKTPDLVDGLIRALQEALEANASSELFR
jgi:hypothetical protein